MGLRNNTRSQVYVEINIHHKSDRLPTVALIFVSWTGRAVGLNENDPEAEVIVAVKTLKTGSANEVKAEFEQEACLMNFLSHPNIVKLLAVSSIEEPYCMVFEFLSKGDLSEYLRKSELLTEDTIKTSENDESKSQSNFLFIEILFIS